MSVLLERVKTTKRRTHEPDEDKEGGASDPGQQQLGLLLVLCGMNTRAYPLRLFRPQLSGLSALPRHPSKRGKLSGGAIVEVSVGEIKDEVGVGHHDD